MGCHLQTSESQRSSSVSGICGSQSHTNFKIMPHLAIVLKAFISVCSSVCGAEVTSKRSDYWTRRLDDQWEGDSLSKWPIRRVFVCLFVFSPLPPKAAPALWHLRFLLLGSHQGIGLSQGSGLEVRVWAARVKTPPTDRHWSSPSCQLCPFRKHWVYSSILGMQKQGPQ